MKENKITRSYTIDKKIYEQFSLYAITLGRSVSSLIEQHMREILKGIEKENK